MRTLSLPLSLAALAMLVACGATAANPTTQASTSAEQSLHKLVKQNWQNRMENAPQATAKQARKYHGPLWPDMSKAHERKITAQKKATLKALEKIDASQLAQSDQLTYRLLEYQLKDTIDGTAYDDADQGLMTQLWGPQLMATRIKQMDLSTLADYQHWLARLKAFGPYLDSFSKRLREAAKKGIAQPRVVMQRVTKEIAANIVDDPTESAFYAPFKHMPESIPANKQAKLRAEAKKAVADGVIPAYRRFLKFYKQDYLPHARTKAGVSNLPDGKAYYRHLVKHYTTTDMTPEQVHKLGLKLVSQIQDRMQKLFKTLGFKGDYKAFPHYLRTNSKFYYSDPDALLEAYRAATKRVDPNLVKVLGTWLLPRVPYGVRPIPTALAPNTYPAYSVPPAHDGSVAGYVGVNLYKPETRPKYAIQVLMCHEGRPGHQLQIPVADELDNLPRFRRDAYYNAFGEGWALYAETLCDKPLGLYDNPYSKFGYLNYQMWRAVRLVVDTGIHYYGWSRDKAVKYMQDHTALADQNIKTEVDRYIVWPGQALSYMIGERTILRLRKEAKAKLGDKYSLKAFDDVVLGEGSLPMSVLSDVVHRWIKRTENGTPADQLPYATKPRSLEAAMSKDDSSPSADATSGKKATSLHPGGGGSSAHGNTPDNFSFNRASLEDPRTLKVWYGQPYAPCYGKLGHVEVEQDKNAVTITLHRIPPKKSGQAMMCSHMIQLKPVEVKLDRPLGKRKVIDGSTGKQVKLGKHGGLQPLPH